MSPLDEIRYINKLAAKKGAKLSAYQRWVRGGCKGPNPGLTGKRTVGKCPDVKPLKLTTKKAAQLTKLLVKLHGALNDAAFQQSSAVSFQRQAQKYLDEARKTSKTIERLFGLKHLEDFL